MVKPDAIQKVHEALGVRLFTPPPLGFNPLTASHQELLLHGFPTRPDPTTHPELSRGWERMLLRPMSRIEPQFSLRTDCRHSTLKPTASVNGAFNWSGSVAFDYPTGRLVSWVAGSWTVPAVVSPSGGGDGYLSAWVGIDGSGSGDILQAGTWHEIVGGSHSTYLWWEWYPDSLVQITNLPVSPGDIMHCLIRVNSPTEADFLLYNLTTRTWTSFTKTAPPGISLTGDSAEWIVERPGVDSIETQLARYEYVYFDNCLAGKKDGTILYGGQGVPVTMLDDRNEPISAPTFETNELIRLSYVRYGRYPKKSYGPPGQG